MLGYEKLSEPAKSLLRAHLTNYEQDGAFVGSFAARQGIPAEGAGIAYNELVAAGFMHPGRREADEGRGVYVLTSTAALVRLWES